MLACTDVGPNEDSGEPGTSPVDGGSEPTPDRISCVFYHRDLGADAGVTPSANGTQELASDIRAPSDLRTTLDGTDIPVHLSVIRESDLSDVVLEFPRSGLEQHYRLATNEAPPPTVAFDHGFSGLNYVTTPGSSVEVQYWCTRNADPLFVPPPPDGGSAALPEPPLAPAPFRLQCTTAVGPQTDSFVLEGANDRSLELGDVQVEIRMISTPVEHARAVVLNVPGRLGQLFQLAESEPVANLTRDPGGLTGQIFVKPLSLDGGAEADGGADAGSNVTVGVWCGAAPD